VSPQRIVDTLIVHTQFTPLALARGATESWSLTVFQASVLAHGDGQGIAEEPQRAVVDRQVRRESAEAGTSSFLATS
jgi:hypothetical protein